MNNEKIPVFLIVGFLEAGKTRFIKYTMEQDYFLTEGDTLLIICEDGEEEYQKDVLEETQTVTVSVDSPEKLTPEYLKELEKIYDPERVIFEWNGMWNPEDLKLPESWELFQQIMIVDGSTFELYLNNMKPLVGAMVRGAEMVVMNRCDDNENLESYRRTLKAMNPQAEVIFEDSKGDVRSISEADLPYDVNAEPIRISPEAYGIWYLDALDKPFRYQGKTVEFTAMVLKAPEYPKNYFVPGRLAITCCEADMTFLGYMCKARNARLLENGQWVKVKARVEYEYSKEFDADGPMLYADYVEPGEKIEGFVEF